MSESSSGTAVIVPHPDGSDTEEDTEERRWRLAEQRGNDIRRARAPPCPKEVGRECFFKVIVVSACSATCLCCTIGMISCCPQSGLWHVQATALHRSCTAIL